jgi:hypothetical protein
MSVCGPLCHQPGHARAILANLRLHGVCFMLLGHSGCFTVTHRDEESHVAILAHEANIAAHAHTIGWLLWPELWRN